MRKLKKFKFRKNGAIAERTGSMCGFEVGDIVGSRKGADDLEEIEVIGFYTDGSEKYLLGTVKTSLALFSSDWVKNELYLIRKIKKESNKESNDDLVNLPIYKCTTLSIKV